MRDSEVAQSVWFGLAPAGRSYRFELDPDVAKYAVRIGGTWLLAADV